MVLFHPTLLVLTPFLVVQLIGPGLQGPRARLALTIRLLNKKGGFLTPLLKFCLTKGEMLRMWTYIFRKDRVAYHLYYFLSSCDRLVPVHNRTLTCSNAFLLFLFLFLFLRSQRKRPWNSLTIKKDIIVTLAVSSTKIPSIQAGIMIVIISWISTYKNAKLKKP